MYGADMLKAHLPMDVLVAGCTRRDLSDDLSKRGEHREF